MGEQTSLIDQALTHLQALTDEEETRERRHGAVTQAVTEAMDEMAKAGYDLDNPKIIGRAVEAIGRVDSDRLDSFDREVRDMLVNRLQALKDEAEQRRSKARGAREPGP